MATQTTTGAGRVQPMSAEERKVIIASSAGTVFEWYDFDMLGRKFTFLVTILIMGGSTFIVGILPTSDQIGIAAPIILIILRLLQGLALGGEYGGPDPAI